MLTSKSPWSMRGYVDHACASLMMRGISFCVPNPAPWLFCECSQRSNMYQPLAHMMTERLQWGPFAVRYHGVVHISYLESFLSATKLSWTINTTQSVTLYVNIITLCLTYVSNCLNHSDTSVNVVLSLRQFILHICKRPALYWHACVCGCEDSHSFVPPFIYRAALKGTSQVVWIWGEKLHYPACSR